jgi:hypothetical protein
MLDAVECYSCGDVVAEKDAVYERLNRYEMGYHCQNCKNDEVLESEDQD